MYTSKSDKPGIHDIRLDPIRHGKYRVSTRFSNKHVPKSPFIIKVYQGEKSMHQCTLGTSVQLLGVSVQLLCVCLYSYCVCICTAAVCVSCTYICCVCICTAIVCVYVFCTFILCVSCTAAVCVYVRTYVHAFQLLWLTHYIFCPVNHHRQCIYQSPLKATSD